MGWLVGSVASWMASPFVVWKGAPDGCVELCLQACAEGF